MKYRELPTGFFQQRASSEVGSAEDVEPVPFKEEYTVSKLRTVVDGGKGNDGSGVLEAGREKRNVPLI
jgi:hypothetical protein